MKARGSWLESLVTVDYPTSVVPVLVGQQVDVLCGGHDMEPRNGYEHR